MLKVIFFAVMGVFLAISTWWAVWVWQSMDGDLSTDGNIALTLGIVFSLVIGVGLMALLFHSARHGYDEQIEYDLPGKRDT